MAKRVPAMLKEKETRPRKFKTAEELEKAIAYYLDSIQMTKPVFIKKKDSPDFTPDEILAMSPEQRQDIWPAKDNNGRQIYDVVWINPPLEGEVMRGIGISDRTEWSGYKQDPEFSDVIHRVECIAEDYIRNKLITREGNTTGLQFALRCGYGWRDIQYQKVETVGKLEDEFL